VPTVTDPQLMTFRDWNFRLRPARKEPARLLVLLHGWQGDENSMWVFTRNLPAVFTILAPRAPMVAPEGGYTWRRVTADTWGFPDLDDFRSSTEALVAFLDDWSDSTGLEASQFGLAGFSQGAAMAYTLALLYPQRIQAVAALSGFLPAGSGNYLEGGTLAGKPFFVAHGCRDERIPVERAHSDVAALEAAGARVTYCESDTGHKVSHQCLVGIENFFRGG
jgi:phospholipase/carboxylesterase